jgi:hypothetical protein
MYFPVVISGRKVADNYWEIPIITSSCCLRKFIYTTGYSTCLFPMTSETIHVHLNIRPFISHLYLHTYTTIHCSPCRCSAHGAYEKAEMMSHVCFSSNGCTQTLSITYYTYSKKFCPHPMLCLPDRVGEIQKTDQNRNRVI